MLLRRGVSHSPRKKQKVISQYSNTKILPISIHLLVSYLCNQITRLMWTCLRAWVIPGERTYIKEFYSSFTFFLKLTCHAMRQRCYTLTSPTDHFISDTNTVGTFLVLFTYLTSTIVSATRNYENDAAPVCF